MRRTLAVAAAIASVAGLTAVGVSGTAGAAPAKGNHLHRPQPTAGWHTLNRFDEADGDGGDDDSAISNNPSLSALCQSLIGDITKYENPAPNVDAIVDDATVTVGSQAGCQTAQNETTLAVNPANPKNLVAGANDYRYYNSRERRFDGSGLAYTTFDGGATWTNVVLPKLTYQTGATGALSAMDSAGDPALAFGPNNTVYYANLVFSRLGPASGITVSVSHDGGLHWDDPVIIHADGVDASGAQSDTPYFNDKEWIGADPNTGKVFVTWTHFTYDDNGNYLESPIVVSSSNDFGATWSGLRPVSPTVGTFTTGITPYNQGSIPKVGIDGAVYVAYNGASCKTLACDQPTDYNAQIMAKSVDGGLTFTNTVIGPEYEFPINEDTGRSTLTGENFRVNSFPQFDIDRVTGRLWVTWADNRNGTYDANGNSVKTNGDVVVATSGNGTAWQTAGVIGSSSDEVYPAIGAYNGRVAVSTYTRSFDPNGVGLDVSMYSWNGVGGIKKPSVSRVTTQTSDPGIQFVGIGAVTGHVLQGVFIGDYTGMVVGSDLVAHPMWTDFRGNPGLTSPNQDAYTQAIPLK